MTETSEQAFETSAPAAGAWVEQATALAGTASITFGAWQVYHPAGYIVGGMILLVGAVISARKASV